MAAEQSYTEGVAFALEETRLERVTANEVLTEAGPLSGDPVPQQLTDMRMVSAGSQTAGSQLDVRTQRGGYPGGTRGAGHVHKRRTDTRWYGWEPPNVFAGVIPISWQDGAGTLKYTRNPAPLTLPDQTILVAYDYRDTAVPAEEYGVRVDICDSVTGVPTSTVQVYSQAGNPVAAGGFTDFFPFMCRLPNGRVWLYLFVYQTDEAQLRGFYSDDGGQSWAVGEQYALPGAINTSSGSGYLPLRGTAVYNNSQVLLVVHLRYGTSGLPDTDDLLWQYASYDLGATFEEVVKQDDGDATSGKGGGGYPAVVAVGPGFGLLFVDSGALGTLTTANPIWCPLGAADQPFTEVLDAGDYVLIESRIAEWAAYSGTPQQFTDGDCACVVDDVGDIYAIGRHPSEPGDRQHEVVVYVSRDNGVTWAELGDGGSAEGAGRLWSVAAATYPERIVAAWAHARLYGAANHVSVGTTWDGSCSFFLGGGYTTLCLPGLERFQDLTRRVCHDTKTFVPLDVPGNMGWTAAGAGSEAVRSDGSLRITTVSQTRTHTVNGGSDATNGVIAEIKVRQVAGGSLTAANIAFWVFAEDSGGTQYQVEVRVDATGYRVWDLLAGGGAGAQVGVDQTTVPGSSGIHFRIAVADGEVLVEHRAADASPERDFARGVQGSLAPGGSGATNRVTWGHIASGTAISDWELVAFVDGSVSVGSTPLTGIGIELGQDNPEELHQRQYATGIRSLGYIGDGVRIAVSDGPTIRGDEWRIDARAQHGLGNALNRRSPRIPWRSTQIAVDEELAFRFSDAEGVTPSDVLVLGFYNCNVPRWEVSTENNAGYQLVGTANAYENLEVAYARLGSEAHPASGGSDTPYLRDNELKGAYIALTDTSSTTVGRRILRQVGGKWTSATTRQANLLLDGEGGANTATNGRIVPPDYVILVPLNGADRKGFKLKALAPSANADARPPEAYWQLGRLFVGWLHLPAEQPSWGRSITLEHGETLEVQRDLTVRSYEDAPESRVVRLGYVDGDNQTLVTGDAADPNYIEASDHASAAPIGVVDAALQDWEGIYRHNKGPKRDMIYLEHFERFGASETLRVLNRRHLHMLCRIESVHRIDSPQGRPDIDEMWRGGETVLVETV